MKSASDVYADSPPRFRASRSLRWRIQLWHAAILGLVILFFIAGTYLHQRRIVQQTIDDELTAAVEVLRGQLNAVERLQAENNQPDATNSLDRLKVPATFAPRRYHHEFEQPYFAIWSADGRLLKTSPPANGPQPLQRLDVPPSAGNHVSPPGRLFSFRNRDGFREATGHTSGGLIIVAGRWVQKDFEALRQLLLALIAGGVLLFLLGTAGGWLLSRTSVAPIAEISRVASKISESNLSDRIDVGRTDTELADLATTLNETFSRLQDAFERQRQFTADASHELRTPLSVVQMHQELALSKERTPQEYREAIETCQRATTRMNSLVESLLTLARLDAAGSQRNRSRIDMGAIASDSARQLEPLANAKQVSLNTDVNEVFVNGDPDQLSQVVTNLLTNAVNYTPAGGKIEISVRSNDNTAELIIADTGCGIAPEELNQVFERFYRIDKQRTRDSGGSGLGLSICKKIVDDHGGSIDAESNVGQGATFRVRLPK